LRIDRFDCKRALTLRPNLDDWLTVVNVNVVNVDVGGVVRGVRLRKGFIIEQRLKDERDMENTVDSKIRQST
jgi:hypothetical protein